jgi:hypothetical protein
MTCLKVNVSSHSFAGTESKAETEAMLRKAMEDYEEKKSNKWKDGILFIGSGKVDPV